jgi:hypothetical protein
VPKVLLWRLEDLTRFFRGVNAHGRQDSTESAIFTLIWASRLHPPTQLHKFLLQLSQTGQNLYRLSALITSLLILCRCSCGTELCSSVEVQLHSNLDLAEVNIVSSKFHLFFLRLFKIFSHVLWLAEIPNLEQWKIFWFVSLAFRHICCSLLQF